MASAAFRLRLTKRESPAREAAPGFVMVIAGVLRRAPSKLLVEKRDGVDAAFITAGRDAEKRQER